MTNLHSSLTATARAQEIDNNNKHSKPLEEAKKMTENTKTRLIGFSIVLFIVSVLTLVVQLTA